MSCSLEMHYGFCCTQRDRQTDRTEERNAFHFAETCYKVGSAQKQEKGGRLKSLTLKTYIHSLASGSFLPPQTFEQDFQNRNSPVTSYTNFPSLKPARMLLPSIPLPKVKRYGAMPRNLFQGIDQNQLRLGLTSRHGPRNVDNGFVNSCFNSHKSAGLWGLLLMGLEAAAGLKRNGSHPGMRGLLKGPSHFDGFPD